MSHAEKFIKGCRSIRKLSKKVHKKNQIKLVLKDFFETNPATVKYILNEYKSMLPHKNDGLIFSRNSTPYLAGKNDNFLKWKPAHMNSIDFLLVPNKKFKALYQR